MTQNTIKKKEEHMLEPTASVTSKGRPQQKGIRTISISIPRLDVALDSLVLSMIGLGSMRCTLHFKGDLFLRKAKSTHMTPKRVGA